MGFLDSIKHGLEGSGVNTQIVAPDWIGANEPTVDVSVTFTAKEKQVVLNGYTVTITREVEETNMDRNMGGGFMGGNGGWNEMNGMGGGMGGAMHDSSRQRVGDGSPIQLEPGAPVTVNVQLPIVGIFGMQQQQGGGGGGLRGMLGSIEAVAQEVNAATEDVEYYIHVKAPVEGSMHHAHASHRIMLRSPGPLGMRF